MKQPVIIMFLLLAILGACRKAASTGSQTATLALKDGTTVSGTVTKSDTSSITIQTPNGVVSTYPVSHVSTIKYGFGSDAASNTPPGEPARQQPSPPPGSVDSSAAPTAVAPPAAARASASPPDREYRPAETFETIPAGTKLSVRTDQSIDSQTANPGRTYPGVVARDVFDTTGQVAIPRGSTATLVIRDSRPQGRIEGRSELAVDVAAIRVHGRQYRLEASDFTESGREGLGANKRTAKFTGGGTLLGTIIGAVAGGGKGAAIGALSGAAAGAATQGLTRGQGVRIPAESVLTFRLEAPIRVREMR